jgi:hypothetical protein
VYLRCFFPAADLKILSLKGMLLAFMSYAPINCQVAPWKAQTKIRTQKNHLAAVLYLRLLNDPHQASYL